MGKSKTNIKDTNQKLNEKQIKFCQLSYGPNRGNGVLSYSGAYDTGNSFKDALACYKMMNAAPNTEIAINNIKIDIRVLNNLSENKKNQIIEILTKDSNV